MFGFRKSAPPAPTASEAESDAKKQDDDDNFGKGSSSAASRNKNKKDLDSMSVQELENYAVDQAEETTKSVNNCLKIAEDIRGDATKTLETLHKQGEQIHRTHEMAANMEKDLSTGEKLLNNLGGMFSMPWKPKKTKTITGPKINPNDNNREKAATAEQKEKLGTGQKAKARGSRQEPTNAMDKVELEKSKQDDALDDLGDILGDLRGMAVEMGTELDRQNQALDDLHGDIDELNSRVKGATRRAQQLAK
ncbi:putative SNAP25 homologous protein SNAP30 [Andrographis paniculata]|uniref:putative SNAP25 homologous protein SNAP30 n=1 Tax=Andrographis paniculata TaxID=175694 RepID=UPI0021E8F592|nr:putative SNAP25 homologous protein SNAP30 [Andrographis paniculata]